jgi:DNA-binding transcriptional LysR family regulator
MKSIARVRGMNLIDLRGVDLNLLVSLDTLLDLKNVTRAAEKLEVAQSTVSAQLARLRKTFDDPLLIPADTGRGMVATSRAEEFQPELKRIIKSVEQLIASQRNFDPISNTKTFNIASSDNGIIGIGLPLIETIGGTGNPGIHIAFHAYNESKIAAQMESGEIDLLIGSERMLPQTMKARKLYDERFVQLQRKGHPRGKRALDLEEYCSLDHLLVSISGGSFHGVIDEHLEKMGRKRNVVLSGQQFTLVPEILRTTDYVCTAPDRLTKRFKHALDAFELPFKAQGFSMYLAWHPRNHADQAISWIREIIIDSIEWSD